jgi:hypothetical protein
MQLAEADHGPALFFAGIADTARGNAVLRSAKPITFIDGAPISGKIREKLPVSSVLG